MAELLARGYITISAVNDGYNPLLTASSVSIPANHDGSKHDLTHAKTLVSLYKGESKVPMFISSIVPSSSGIVYSQRTVDQYTCEVSITKIASNIASGYLEIKIGTSTGFTTSVRFGIAVIKNSSSIDWIQEWDGTKTQIGENYVVTPKIFAGRKGSDGKITGVYLGKIKGFIGEATVPGQIDQDEGIYGYKDNKVVFHISKKDAKIGGWLITHAGIQNTEGTMNILSEGTIFARNNGITNWILRKDGSASFANGKVTMDTAGNATFNGKIIAASGKIALWNIDDDSLWYGSKNNSPSQYTSDIYSITLGSNGIRGHKFRLEKDGSGAIAGGNISWDRTGKVTFSKEVSLAWTESINSLSSKLTKIDSNGIYTGTINANQITAGLITAARLDAQSIKANIINTQYINGLSCTFERGTIGGWSIYKTEIKKGNISLGANGSISCTTNTVVWKIDNLGNALFGSSKSMFNADGSGKVANGNISWDSVGNVTLSTSIKKLWEDKIGALQENVNSQFSTLNGKISAKVDSTLFNTLKQQVQAQGSELQLAKDEIKAKVSQSTFDVEREKQNILAACNDANMVTDDPTFTRGTNNIIVYNNTDNGAVTIARKVGCGVNSSNYYLDIAAAATGAIEPGYGGFTFRYQTKARLRLVCRFSAWLDNGRRFEFATNATGDNSRHFWLTDNQGKGTWADYAYYVECGTRGSFSTTFFFYVMGGNRPVSTWLSYATIHMLSADADFKHRISTAETKITQTANSISLKADKSYVDGINNRLSSAEIALNPDQIWLKVSERVNQVAIDKSKRKTVLIDAMSLDQNIYYPVIIPMTTVVPQYRIKVYRTLNSLLGVPGWSAHEGGFSLMVSWVTNASGWGTIDIKRIVEEAVHWHTNVIPVGSIGQLSNGSIEYIYVRGGSKYYFEIEGATDVGVYLKTGSYTNNGQTVAPQTKVTFPQREQPTREEIKAGIGVTAGGVTVFGKTISLNGVVTFSSLKQGSDGESIIDGGKIKTNLINVKSLFAEEITATRFNLAGGTIGGFKVNSGYLGLNQASLEEGMSLYSTGVYFRSPNKKVFLGTEMSAFADQLLHLENTDSSYLPHIGLKFNIKGSNTYNNFAFVGNGNGTLNGFIEGYMLNYIDFSDDNQHHIINFAYGKYVEINVNRFGCAVYLPRLSSLRDTLGISAGKDFAVRMTIVQRDGRGIRIYGRRNYSVGSTNFGTGDFPWLRNNNFGNEESWELSPGDCVEVLLTYSINEYNAYTVNIHR